MQSFDQFLYLIKSYSSSCGNGVEMALSIIFDIFSPQQGIDMELKMPFLQTEPIAEAGQRFIIIT